MTIPVGLADCVLDVMFISSAVCIKQPSHRGRVLQFGPGGCVMNFQNLEGRDSFLTFSLFPERLLQECVLQGQR